MSDTTEAGFEVVMHALARDGRAMMIGVSDERVGFELDDEDRVLALADGRPGLVALEGRGRFIDEGRPTLTPVNCHEPLNWRVVEREGLANLICKVLDAPPFMPVVRITPEALAQLEADLRGMKNRHMGRMAITPMSISGPRIVATE